MFNWCWLDTSSSSSPPTSPSPPADFVPAAASLSLSPPADGAARPSGLLCCPAVGVPLLHRVLRLRRTNGRRRQRTRAGPGRGRRGRRPPPPPSPPADGAARAPHSLCSPPRVDLLGRSRPPSAEHERPSPPEARRVAVFETRCSPARCLLLLPLLHHVAVFCSCHRRHHADDLLLFVSAKHELRWSRDSRDAAPVKRGVFRDAPQSYITVSASRRRAPSVLNVLHE